jgi:lipopolysaccharide biosynthesis glycosyltransferase
MTLHLACAADAAYLPHCAAMLHSVALRQGRDAVQVHFLAAPSLSAADLLPLRQMLEQLGCALRVHAIDERWVEGLPEIYCIPRVMWYRVLLPQLLPELDRILYLDADTLAVDRLDALWNTELGDHYVAAVDNVLERRNARRPAELGLAPEQGYFNSGVLLLNLAAMRRDGCSAEIMQYARSMGTRLLWPDQDALNVVLGRRRIRLAPRWNCQNSFYFLPERYQVFTAEELRATLAAPGILHFEGPPLFKPWSWNCRHPRQQLYLEHRAQTPWPMPPPAAGNLWEQLLRATPLPLLPYALRGRQRWDRLRKRLASNGTPSSNAR